MAFRLGDGTLLMSGEEWREIRSASYVTITATTTVLDVPVVVSPFVPGAQTLTERLAVRLFSMFKEKP